MKIYKTTCIDAKTNLEIVASEIGYNQACWYVDSKAKLHMFRVFGVEDRIVNGYPLRAIRCTAGITFYHDEIRDLLLKEIK